MMAAVPWSRLRHSDVTARMVLPGSDVKVLLIGVMSQTLVVMVELAFRMWQWQIIIAVIAWLRGQERTVT